MANSIICSQVFGSMARSDMLESHFAVCKATTESYAVKKKINNNNNCLNEFKR